MSALKPPTIAIVVVVVLVAVAPASAGASGTTAAAAYTGSHVSFETSGSAVTDYAVDGEAVLSSVKVQSASSAEGSGLVSAGADLSTVTSLEGAGLSLSAKTETSATVEAESSASMTAHDNGHGILVVESGGEEQYVKADLGSGAQAEADGDSRVTVTTGDGVKGTFIVVGDGQVTVNEEGDVAAKLGEDGKLVFRAYPDGKSDDDAAQERLIADGRAAAEVHVMRQDGETVTDTVTYGSETTVEAQQSAEGRVDVTVDRAKHEGQVVITTVSESMLDSSGDLSVEVDGRAAARASSYSELESAIGSDQSKYMVEQSSAAEGRAEVLVAVNHFSERTVTMSDSDGSSSSDGGDGSAADTDGSSDDGGDATSTPGQPGFGVLVAVLALLAAALLARYRG